MDNSIPSTKILDFILFEEFMLLFRAQALSASLLITVIFDACVVKVLFWDLILVAQHELQSAWRVETLWEAISWGGVLNSEVKMVV